MDITNFDQLSFNADELKKFLTKSPHLKISFLHCESKNGDRGDVLYLCNKDNISGWQEAFVSLYNHYIHDIEGVDFNPDHENLNTLLDNEIIPALRKYSFDFKSSEHTNGEIYAFLDDMKTAWFNGKARAKVHTKFGLCEDISVGKVTLDKIEAIDISELIYGDSINKIYLFDTCDSYLLFHILDKGGWYKRREAQRH